MPTGLMFCRGTETERLGKHQIDGCKGQSKNAGMEDNKINLNYVLEKSRGRGRIRREQKVKKKKASTSIPIRKIS